MRAGRVVALVEHEASRPEQAAVIAVDIGGTFTDVALHAGDRLFRTAKVLSTPSDYSAGVLEGIQAVVAGSGLAPSLVVHGTTVATNAVLAGTGLARAALVTTAGFRDVLELGRCKRAKEYSLDWEKPAAAIPRSRILEIAEYTTGAALVLESPSERDLETLAQRLAELNVEAVGVSLINSYANSANEEKVATYLREVAGFRFVTTGAELTRTIGEYERTSTVALNAALLPLVSDYVLKLSESLPRLNGVAPPLYVMTSNGGVVPEYVARRRPVALLESGPAAGVLGAGGIARTLEIDRVIAFDMGGTTAKACLIENCRPAEARDYEVGGEINNANLLTRGGGHLVRLPCFEISEVGTGGGSIAAVDAEGILHVGPESAGADPGPACYGRGGLLPTVTDANLVLGYLPDGDLGSGIQLEHEPARDAIRRHVAEPLGLEIADAALAIHTLANASIARALRSVSIERGRDPSKCSMIVFGGAGPTHAVAVAREIGLRQIIVPVSAGVFSAVGMLSADVRFDSVVATDLGLGDVDGLLAERMDEIRRDLARDLESAGVDVGDAEFTTHLEMKYRAQTWCVLVDVPENVTASALEAEFLSTYQQLHGHTADDEIVIAAVKVSLVARRGGGDSRETQTLAESSQAETRGAIPNEIRMAEVYLGPKLGWVQAPLLTERTAVASGRDGPFLLREAESSTFVPLGCRVSLARDDSLVIEVESDPQLAPSRLRGAELGVLRHKLEAIADEMGTTIFHTSRSIVVQNFDFAAALGTPEGGVAAKGVGNLIHIATLPTAIKAVRDVYDDLAEGDVIVLNDPYAGGTHLPDIVMVAPVFAESQLVAYTFSLAHHSDVGGSTPGSYTLDSHDLFSEGTIIPPIRLVRQGVVNSDIWRLILRNTRTPAEVGGDLQAQLAANHVAARQLRALVDQLGVARLRTGMQELADYTERLTRRALRDLPNGIYSADDFIDSDGASDEPIRLSVDVTIRDESVTADFSRSSPQVRTAINCNVSVITAEVHKAFRIILSDDIPHNAGFDRCFDVETVPGTILNPVFPAPVAARSVPGLRCGDLLMLALAPAAPGRVWAAGSGGPFLVVIAGERESGTYVLLDFLGAGTGGRPHKDGLEGADVVPNQSVEDIESRFPIRVSAYGFVRGTGGRGTYRGTNAVLREWELLGESAHVFCRTDRQLHAPWGLFGGEPGARAVSAIRRAGSDRWEPLRNLAQLQMGRGDRVRVQMAGGGGYGPPTDRDPLLMERDEVEERV